MYDVVCLVRLEKQPTRHQKPSIQVEMNENRNCHDTK